MTDRIGIDYLERATISLQHLTKKFRNLRNRGDVSEADLRDVRDALAMLRSICDRHGIQSPDIDSRGARGK